MIFNLCKCDVLKYLSYRQCGSNFIVSPLLGKSDNVILKLHQKKSGYLDEGWPFISIFKIESAPGMGNSIISPVLKKFRNLLLYVYWRKRVGKRGNNLQVCNVRFLIWLFKLSSITLPIVLIAKILFLLCYFCIVILLEMPSTRSSHISHGSHWAKSVTNTLMSEQ